jgi:hypothetical protein
MSKTIKLGSWVIAVDKIAAVVRNTDKEFTLYLVGIMQPFVNSYNDSARCDKDYQMLIKAMEGEEFFVSGEELYSKFLKKHGKEEKGI